MIAHRAASVFCEMGGVDCADGCAECAQSLNNADGGCSMVREFEEEVRDMIIDLWPR